LTISGSYMERKSAAGPNSHPFRSLLPAIESRSHKRIQSVVFFSDANSRDINPLVDCPPQDRWIIAKHLLDYGVAVNSLIEHAMKAEEPDKSLISILLDTCSNKRLTKETIRRRGYIRLLSLAECHLYLNNSLIKAVETGSREGVREAIEAGANPSWALSTALRLNRLDLARYLLFQGADPRVLNIVGDLRSKIRDSEVSAMIAQAARWNDKQLLDVLLMQGGDFNSIDPESQESVLVEAIKATSYACVEYLLERGAYANGSYISRGTRPLTAALITRQSDIVSLLLRHGASYESDLGDEASCQIDLDDETFDENDLGDLDSYAIGLGYGTSYEVGVDDGTLHENDSFKPICSAD
jgi:hypothetical protein